MHALNFHKRYFQIIGQKELIDTSIRFFLNNNQKNHWKLGPSIVKLMNMNNFGVLSLEKTSLKLTLVNLKI